MTNQHSLWAQNSVGVTSLNTLQASIFPLLEAVSHQLELPAFSWLVISTSTETKPDPRLTMLSLTKLSLQMAQFSLLLLSRAPIFLGPEGWIQQLWYCHRVHAENFPIDPSLGRNIHCWPRLPRGLHQCK